MYTYNKCYFSITYYYSIYKPFELAIIFILSCFHFSNLVMCFSKYIYLALIYFYFNFCLSIFSTSTYFISNCVYNIYIYI